jgi:hypothetical protein
MSGSTLESSKVLLTTCAAMVVGTAALTWRVSAVGGAITIQGVQLQALRTEVGVRLDGMSREQDRLREEVTALRNEFSSALSRQANGSKR